MVHTTSTPCFLVGAHPIKYSIERGNVKNGGKDEFLFTRWFLNILSKQNKQQQQKKEAARQRKEKKKSEFTRSEQRLHSCCGCRFPSEWIIEARRDSTPGCLYPQHSNTSELKKLTPLTHLHTCRLKRKHTTNPSLSLSLSFSPFLPLPLLGALPDAQSCIPIPYTLDQIQFLHQTQ